VEPAGEGDRAGLRNGLNVWTSALQLRNGGSKLCLDKPRSSLLNFLNMTVPIVDCFVLVITRFFSDMGYIDWAYYEEAGPKGVVVEESIEESSDPSLN